MNSAIFAACRVVIALPREGTQINLHPPATVVKLFTERISSPSRAGLRTPERTKYLVQKNLRLLLPDGN